VNDKLLGARASRKLSASEVSDLYSERHLAGLTRVASILGANLDVVGSDGAWLILRDGSRVLDCHASYGGVAFGHRHPALLEAARESLAEMTTGLPGLLASPVVAALCHDLVAIAPAGMERALLYSTGAETIEGALVLATLAQGKDQRDIFVGFEGGFHGKTAAARTVGGIPNERQGFHDWGRVETLPFGDIETLEGFFRHSGSRVSALVVEPIQSNSGVRIPPEGWLAKVQRACEQAGALMIVDEVSTGLGRTGQFFVCESEGVVPDMICISKGLSGGLVPVGAVLVNKRLAKITNATASASHFSTTFAGGDLACSVALEVVRLLVEEGLPERVRASGARIEEGLLALRAKHPRLIRDVRGRGHLWALELADPADLPKLVKMKGFSDFLADRVGGTLAIALQRYLLRHCGLLVGPTAGDRRVIRMFPSLLAEERDIEALLGGLGRAFEAGISTWVRKLA
jgi:acetylornithine/succinyldiaminopimelate/putrescine aminotransferase